MQRPCQWRNILGVPGEGVHRHVLGVAWIDVVATLVAAAVIALSTTTAATADKNIYQCTASWFVRLFIAGQLLHWYFCVDTAFIRLLRC